MENNNPENPNVPQDPLIEKNRRIVTKKEGFKSLLHFGLATV